MHQVKASDGLNAVATRNGDCVSFRAHFHERCTSICCTYLQSIRFVELQRIFIFRKGIDLRTEYTIIL